MACKALQVLALVSSAFALSSTSPLDLFAHPRYAIVLTHHSISNETATELLAQTPSKGEAAYHLMRTNAGQGFLCLVPPASSVQLHPSASAAAEERKKKAREDHKAGLDRGLALLEPLKGSCLYLRQGWFTYSFCHGSEIRQFHEVRAAGSHLPTEDPNFEAYSLGQYAQPSAEVAAGVTTGALADVLAGSAGLDLDDAEKRYLVQKWRGGTLCDKTGLERSVQVQFHCNTQSTDRIALIREVSICEYVMVVHTPRLCGEPTFLGNENDPMRSTTLETRCQPIVNAPPAAQIDATLSSEPIVELVVPAAEGSEPVAEPSAEDAPSTAETQIEEELDDAAPAEETVEAIADAIQNVLDSTDLATDLMVTLDTQTGEFHVEKHPEHVPAEGDDAKAIEEATQRIDKFGDMLKEAIEKTVQILEQLRDPNDPDSFANNAKLRQLVVDMDESKAAAQQARQQDGAPATAQQPQRMQHDIPQPGSSKHHRLARMYAQRFDGSEKEEDEHVQRPKDEL